MGERCAETCADWERLEGRVEEYRAQNAASHQQIYDRLNALERGEAARAVQYRTIVDKLDLLTRKLEVLESKPGKRWEGLMEKALWAVAAAVIAFLLGRVGL